MGIQVGGEVGRTWEELGGGKNIIRIEKNLFSILKVWA